MCESQDWMLKLTHVIGAVFNYCAKIRNNNIKYMHNKILTELVALRVLLLIILIIFNHALCKNKQILY